MDLSFRHLDARRSDVVPAPLDYLRLVASLAAMQASSRTAAVEATLSTGTFVPRQPVEAMADLLGPGPGWADAVTTLEGSFHPAIAAGRRIGPP